jgi:hypothetical protein
MNAKTVEEIAPLKKALTRRNTCVDHESWVPGEKAHSFRS